MDAVSNEKSSALRLAGLRLEISCLDVLLAAERRRERRDLDAPLSVPRIRQTVGLTARD